MAHELSFVSGQAEMFCVGEPAWHGHGTNVQKAVKAKEAMKLAHLNWKIEQQPIYLKDGTTIKDRVANTRKDKDGNSIILGTVSQKYKPIQNHEAFEFFDEVVGEGQAIYHTAGALREGRRVWILAKLPTYITVGNDDATEKFLLLTNGNDGTHALRMFFTPVRVVCSNTLTAAFQGSDADKGIKISHTGNVKDKVKAAAHILNLADNHFRKLETYFNRFAEFKLSDQKAENYFMEIMPGETKIMTERRTKIRENYQSGRGAELTRGTLWGAYNAVTEFEDQTRYENRKKGLSARFESNVFGSGRKVKQLAFDTAVSLVGK